MREIKYRNIFKKDVKLAQKRGKDLSKLAEVIKLLENEQILTSKYRDHNLVGNHNGHRECHLEPNWLLIYKIDNDMLLLERLGSHSDLFKS